MNLVEVGTQLISFHDSRLPRFVTSSKAAERLEVSYLCPVEAQLRSGARRPLP